MSCTDAVTMNIIPPTRPAGKLQKSNYASIDPKVANGIRGQHLHVLRQRQRCKKHKHHPQHPAAPPPLQQHSAQHQRTNSKAHTALWQQHPNSSTLQRRKGTPHFDSSALQQHLAGPPARRQPATKPQSANSALTALYSGTGNQAPERKQHSDNSTVQGRPATAPATKFLSANSTLTEASWRGTLQQQPTKFQSTNSSL